VRPETEWRTATQRAEASGVAFVLPVFKPIQGEGAHPRKRGVHAGTPLMWLVRRDRQNERAGRLSRPGRAL